MLIAFLSLIAGILSVFAPCVLPLLPIIIGGSLTGTVNKKRPYIIISSLVFSLILFTLILKASTALLGIDPRTWSYISGSIVIALGLALLFPDQWDKVIGNLGVQAKSQRLLGSAGRQKNGTLSAILTGFALGPVFSSCSPMYTWVIATVLPESSIRGLVYLSFYCVGLSAALLAIALLGNRFLKRITLATDPHGWFQRIIAILFVLVGLAVFTGFDKTVQTYLVDKDFLNIKSLEEKLIPDDEDANDNKAEQRDMNQPEYFNVKPYQAPELTGLQEWINSDPLTLEQLKGKVILIDFWTYSCINCIRTFPYLRDWYDHYKDDGFVILGMHAPEFAFEKLPENVQRAVNDRNLTYPIALDNDFATWRAYKNRFWPAHYLIDKNGQVRREHFGEGEYDETEAAIRDLLAETGATDLGDMTADDAVPPITGSQTPETYLGIARAQRNTNTDLIKGQSDYTASDDQYLNSWSLGGTWMVEDEYAECVRNCLLKLHYQAKDVYAVFSAASAGSITIGDRKININNDDLYTLIENEKFQNTTTTIYFTPGLAIHAFTFGS